MLILVLVVVAAVDVVAVDDPVVLERSFQPLAVLVVVAAVADRRSSGCCQLPFLYGIAVAVGLDKMCTHIDHNVFPVVAVAGDGSYNILHSLSGSRIDHSI